MNTELLNALSSDVHVMDENELDFWMDAFRKMLSLSIDARYGMANEDNLLTEKEHIELWDKVFEMKCEKERRKVGS